MTITGHQYEISAGEHWAAVSEVGANLRGYRHAGRDVTPVHDPNDLPPKSSGAVLMPWPNRIREGQYRFADVDLQLSLTEPLARNASHGLANWIRWAPVEQSGEAITMQADVVPQKGWPFELRAQVTYRVDPAQGLVVRLHAVNLGAHAFPFGAGSHPYIALGDTALERAELRVPATRYLQTDAAQIPIRTLDVQGTDFDFRQRRAVGSTRLDHALTGLITDGVRGTAEVVADGRTTTLWWDAARFTTLQVFTLPRLVDGAAIAIEPMTCPANAFNSGVDLITLAPGQEWAAQWGIVAG